MMITCSNIPQLQDIEQFNQDHAIINLILSEKQ